MNRDRIIQTIAIVVTAGSLFGASMLLPGILRQSEERSLRYTNVSVEGAPPFVVLGTMIGALRGVIVDFLWIKVNIMKERGQFFEVMANADLITKLQPRFAGVWAFHGHNMAYNISVATYTQEERWDWVNAGLRLVRDEGIRANPNNLLLHKELAFWFAHKVEGTADDAHQFYKRMFCREWHSILGEPPETHEERTAWIKAIADAPSRLEDLIQAEPKVAEIVALLEQPEVQGGPPRTLALDSALLAEFAAWDAVTRQSTFAEILGLADDLESTPGFTRINDVAGDPQYAEAWEAFIRHVRRRVLLDEYNMDPQLMYEYTRDLGPLDWRHAQAHALYWSRRGSQLGEHRIREYDIYHVINNDRIQVQAMQGLARSGRILFDPFSQELPGRLPDPRWIDPIDTMFEELYVKHYDTRGAGGETFIAFLQNFMSSSICMWYRAGEIERAQGLMNRLDELFGSGAKTPNPTYQMPLDVFVQKETFDQYELQPHLAPRDVNASLRYGLITGIGRGRPEIYENALDFSRKVTGFFKQSETVNYTNEFGVRRQDMLSSLEGSTRLALSQVMADRTIPLELRMTVWSRIDQHDKTEFLRHYVYDRLQPVIANELQTSPWGRRFTIEQVFPEPPGMDAYRVWYAQKVREAREREEAYSADVATDGGR